MKKLICLMLAFLTIALGVTVAASIANIPVATPVAEEEPELYPTYDSEPAFAQISLPDESASAVSQQLNRSGKPKNEVYSDIFDYLHFKRYYAPAAQDMAYLDSLIAQGADLHTLTEIYEFYLTTGEPVEIVGDIYDISSRFSGPYWVEEAFNHVTQNAHGVLDKEQIGLYLSEGVDSEDIKIANVLSRRGTATVTELLDRFRQGASWAVLIAETGSIGAHPALAGAVGQIETEQELLTAIRYAAIMPQDATLSAAGDLFVSMRQAMEDYAVALNGEVYSQLLSEGIYPRDDSEQNAGANEAYRQRAADNGLSEAQIDALLDEGYPMLDILNASEQAKVQNAAPEQILDKQRTERLEEAEEVEAQ